LSGAHYRRDSRPPAHRFHLDPAPHTRFAALHSLADDIALALRTPSVTIHRGQEGVILEFAHPDPQPVMLLPLLHTIGTLPSGAALLGIQANGVPLLRSSPVPKWRTSWWPGRPAVAKACCCAR
jgi:hypothetical protein